MAVSRVKAMINGSEYVLTYNSQTRAYEGTITAPGKSSYNQKNGFYDIGLTAYDDSGNSKTINSSDTTLGDKLKLYVKENVAPEINITYPTDKAIIINNKPTISWKCSDFDSGINEKSIKLYLDNAEVDGEITVQKIENAYTCSYIPSTAILDGSHSLKFLCFDNDGNKTEKTINIKVDTVAPTLTVSYPQENINTNIPVITVTGYTNDAVSSPVSVTVNGEKASVNANGYFSLDINLQLGDNIVEVIATDAAGKQTTITRVVNYNNIAPEFQNISITPNPVDAGSSFKISVMVTDE